MSRAGPWLWLQHKLPVQMHAFGPHFIHECDHANQWKYDWQAAWRLADRLCVEVASQRQWGMWQLDVTGWVPVSLCVPSTPHRQAQYAPGSLACMGGSRLWVCAYRCWLCSQDSTKQVVMAMGTVVCAQRGGTGSALGVFLPQQRRAEASAVWLMIASPGAERSAYRALRVWHDVNFSFTMAATAHLNNCTGVGAHSG
jgi:hypothetical protein